MRGGRGLCLCNKTCARFYLLAQRVFCVWALVFLIWHSASGNIWRSPKTWNWVTCELSVASGFLSSLGIAALHRSVHLKEGYMLFPRCHIAAFSLSWEPAPQCPDPVLPSFWYVTFKFSLMQLQVCRLHWAGLIHPQVETLNLHTESTLYRFWLWLCFSFLFEFCFLFCKILK